MALMEPSQDIYRREALIQVRTTEQLNQLIRIVTPKSWLILLSLWGLLLAIIIWGFIGSIPTRVNGQGILLAENGSVFVASIHQGNAIVSKITVHPGQEIRQGQIVAILDNPQLAKQVEEATIYLAQLQKQYQELQQTADNAISERHQQFLSQEQTLNRIIVSQQENLAFIEEWLATRKKAQQRGIETKIGVSQTTQEYYYTKQQIENAQSQLTNSRISEKEYIDNWNDRLRELNLKIKDEQHRLNDMQLQLKISHTVTSSIDGTVISIQKSIGDVVASGEAIVNIATKDIILDALIYIPPNEGKRVKVGMGALIVPSTVKREEYGSIKGKVVAISDYPVSQETMLATLKNPDLVKNYMKEGSPFAARIKLSRDMLTKSHYAWTSSHGPNQIFTPGTLATAQITVREQPPISLIIPAFKKFLGIM